MPPDIYKKEGYSYEFDYYSFGVLIYELIAGCSPFGYGGSNKKILEGKCIDINLDV
jgi:serine/threonine protein kinase